LFLFLVSDHYYLVAVIYDNLQDLEEEDFEPPQAGEQGNCPEPYRTSFLSIFTHSHALN
jgi:hypothetical protein